MREPIILHPHQHLALSVILILAILIGVLWYSSVALNGVSLMRCDVEHLFHMCICHLYIFWGEMPVQGCGLFLMGLFVFLFLSFKSSLDTVHYQMLDIREQGRHVKSFRKGVYTIC